MKKPLPATAAMTTLGAIIGAGLALRWIHVTAAAGGPETAWSTALTHSGLATTLALSILGLLALRIAAGHWFSVPAQRIALLASVVTGLSAYLLLTSIFGTLSAADPRYPSWAACGLIAAGAAAMATRRRRLALALLLALPAAFEPARSLRMLTGDDLAVASLAYASLPALREHAAMAYPLALVGAICGYIWSCLTANGTIRALGAGAAIGVILALCASCAQTTTYLAAMGSGQDPGSIIRVSAVTWASLAAAAALAVIGSTGYRRRGLLRLAPVVVLAAIAEYSFVATYGAAEFHSLSRRGPDSTYAYIHFLSDGTWRRTRDEQGSAAQTETARRLIAEYPYSAYRPAAMLAAAEGDFKLWEFDEASAILRGLRARYPVLDGYGSVLLALSDLAGGNQATILHRAVDGSRFAAWRATQGAQMAASAAEMLGQPIRARGLHSAYIDYLLRRPGASWTSQALAFSEARLDSLTENSSRRARKAIVCFRVTTDAGPVPGARVILVQPHPDAALPSDSSRFTGAWTIPAWNGVWGVADEDGVVTIRGVPWGDYEVVLGLDFRAAPRRYVVKQGVPPVRVAGARLKTRSIRLVPAVNQVQPESGAAVGRNVTLAWEAYPGARSYAVSVVALGGRQLGSTCWARSGITSTHTPIDDMHFIDGHPSLEKAKAYMWIVYAYRVDGSLLSSSEHYFDLNERTFISN